MNRILATLALVLVALYGGYKAIPLLAGPSISLTSPQQTQVFPDNTVLVKGTTKQTENLTLNGTLLPIDSEGRFEKTLIISSGGAILSLTATDRFGKSVAVTRSVFIP